MKPPSTTPAPGRNLGVPLRDFNSHSASSSRCSLNNSYLLALHLGRLKDAGQLQPEQVSFGKLHNVQKALDVARSARTILGANGVTLEYPVMRHMANLESVLTYEGTGEIHTLVVGQAISGIAAFR